MQALKSIYFLCLLGSCVCLQAQQKDPDIRLAIQLDSMAKISAVSSHFARLYLETTLLAIDFFNNAPTDEKQFIERLEVRFASFFFKAVQAEPENRPLVWKTYFSDTDRSALQYQLLGINAHINGDIWQALISEFSLAELKQFKKSYTRFQKGLKKQFLRFYHESTRLAVLPHILHQGTAGLAAQYGKWMLAHWRKRQYRLAILFYTNQGKHQKSLYRITRKKERMDCLILRHL